MSSDSPNAAPPCATMPTQRSSVSALLALQSLRSAGGTSRRVVAAGVPRPSAPWHDLHHAWNNAPPLSRGAWVASNSATTGASVTEGERYAWRPSEFGERWRLDSGAQHAILSRRSTALHIPRDDRYLPHTPAAGVPMRPLPCTFVAALCTAPLISLVAQEPRGVLVPVGALVKAESAQSGKTTEGTVLAWRGDTLVMRAAEGGDTVRIPAAALKKLRIAESPTVWRHTSPSEINFFASVAVPRSGDADRSSGDAFRDALLIAHKTELATGKVRWRRDHLFGLEPKVFGTGGVSYLFGHQPPLADTDTTFVLYLSADGPIRVHAHTGALVWGTDAFHDAKVPMLRDGYARIARRQGVLFVPSEKRLVALNVSDGHAAWPAPLTFKSQVIRMDVTRHGLLARGDEWLDLLDPATGRSVCRAPATLQNTTRIVPR